jgi:RHS repeat-associated protein
VRAQEEAKRDSPEAVAAREESRTKFEGLSSERAGKVDGEAFPEAIDRPAGTLPPLPAGQRVVGYPADNAAQVDLGGGRHGVIESTEQLAIESSPGRREPLDLGLAEAGGGFEPVRSSAGVRVPKQLANGVQLATSGVSLTPVDASGAALSGSEGTVDGATVLYANTQTDADTVVKSTAAGFEEDTLLRSVSSPSQLSFRVGLPVGASVISGRDGSGNVDVVDEGAVIAVVLAPSARDAEGVVVPVSTSVSGDTLHVQVDQSAGSYRYPIVVDPTVESIEGRILYRQTWGFFTENASVFQVAEVEGLSGNHYVQDVVSKSVKAGERAFFYYPTQGESRIYAVKAFTNFEGFAGSKMENLLGIWNVHTGKPEVSQTWIENYGAEPTLCTEPGCASGTVNASNDKSEIFYQQSERETNEWGGGTAHLYGATVDIVQEAGPSISFLGPNEWVNASGKVAQEAVVEASDPGLGIDKVSWTSSNNPGWDTSYRPAGCGGVQCEEHVSLGRKVSNWGFPEGEDPIEATVEDAVGLKASVKGTLRVDNQSPQNLTLTGFPASHEISFGRYVVKVSATDGSGSTPSSGVASIKLAIDGKEVGAPRGSCSPGPCTGTGEWVISGEEYAAGKHTFTMTATDGAGNVAKQEFPLTIESSESKGVGPGSVDLTSGAYTLQASDVSIAAPGGGLTLQRAYNSDHLAAGAEGPLGPQWSGLGLGDTQSLVKLPTGSMLLTAGNGRQSVFAKEGSKFVSPTGDANMTLGETEANVFTLTEQNGTVTTFTLPSGGSGTLFTPYTREEPGHAGAVKYTYQTVGGITEPTQALAPVPAGVGCTTLVKGCRALTFNYASSTTATGEGESEWGEYKGRLSSVSFVAYSPTSKEMQTTAVAQYSYDKQGRLRAEWDPRVSPALKTTYGYDAEGHVASLTPPGQETWAFTYAPTASDPTNTGRLLKVTQAPASVALWNGKALVNSEAPKLSGTPMVGNRMGVSNGAWSNGPTTYAYQWERCGSTSNECSPIVGAVNPNYTPVEADVGHMLAATVTAINGDGSLTAVTTVSNMVTSSGAPAYVSSTPGAPAGYKAPADVAVSSASGSRGDVWVLDAGDNQLVEFNEWGEFLRRVGSAGSGNGQLSSPDALAVDSKGNVWVADTGNNRIQEFNEKGEYIQSFGSQGSGDGQFKKLHGVTVDSKGNVWVADYENFRVQEFNEKGEYQQQFATKELGAPRGVAIDAGGNVWVTTGLITTGVQEFNEKGQYLQKFGTEGIGNGQFKEPQSIVVREKHVWIADMGNNRVQEIGEKGEYQKQFGTKGEGNGQLNGPSGLTLDFRGNVWVADTGNNRVQEFNEKGEYQKQFVNQGTAKGEMGRPYGVVSSAGGNVWVVDSSNAKLVEFNERGQYLTQFGTKGSGNGELWAPSWITVNNKGDLWVVDNGGFPIKVEEFTESGKYESQFGSEGTGNGQFEFPNGIAVNSQGDIWIVDRGNNRVEEFNEKGEFLSKFGSVGTGNGQFEFPWAIAVDSKGNLWVTDSANARVEKFNEKGEFLQAFGTYGQGAGQLRNPDGIAVDSASNIWVVDSNNGRVEEFNQKGEYLAQFGSSGRGVGQFEEPSGITVDPKGNIWVSDSTNNREQHWQVISKVEAAEALPVAPGSTVEYGVPVSGSGAPHALGSGEAEKWAQKDDPSEATAIFPPDEPQSAPASDYRRAAVYYLDNHGRTVNVASPGGAIATSEYNSTDDVVRSLSAKNREAALKEGAKSAETSKLLDTQSTYNSEGTELTSTLGPQHTVKLANGSTVEARDHKQYYYDEGAPTEGGPYRLTTKVTDGAQYSGKEEDIRTTTTSYAGQENLGWKLHKPTSVTTDPSGLKLAHTILYESATGNVIETRTPANAQEKSPHATETIYYTTAKNSSYPACGERPEWANLPCQTQPAKQPETSGLPKLPVTTVTYNVWDEPEKTTATVESKTRTSTSTYDTAGRSKTSATTSTVGVALPTITDEYNTETGALEKQCANEGKPCTEGKPKTITNTYNKRGQLEAYTDADESKSTYEYDEDGRIKKTNDGKGTQTYAYDTTTGLVSELTDSSHEGMKFTAAYDVEGNMLNEGYPNGMNANYTYDSTGKPTALEYKKTTHCTEKCVWFSDSVVPSIHGQWLSQTSTLSSQAYAYDAAGRLTQVQNTPAGKGCTTRIYAYEEDTNRVSLTTREPGSKGECQTTGGTVEKHTYDTADRLIDAGTSYNTFGNITALPATDAGGTQLTSSFYVDNQLQSQTQNGQTIGYNLDPALRTRETVSTGKTNSTVTSHYAGASQSPAWTVNTTSEWTRNIPGINGNLAAIQNNGETPVLQLTNLHGDIIATAYLSETVTELASKADTTEFGVPAVNAPPKYSWLGGIELSTELPSGVIAMGARSYVPQLGRFLQSDPIGGGSANAYTYTYGDPVNASDPSGAYTVGGPSQSLINGTAEQASHAAAEQAAINAAARAEAERKQREAMAAQAAAAGPQYEEEEAEEAGGKPGEVIWESENGGCSGASACASSFLGIKVDIGEIDEWWKKVKRGFELVKESIASGLEENLRENSTVCKVVGYATTAGLYFIPESRFAKQLGLVVGFGTTYAC